jgi:diaminopimelate decarboxylase
MKKEFWWQRADLFYRNSSLQLDGQSVEKLAKQFPTPAFIYSARRIKYNLLRLKVALDEAGLEGQHKIYYAMKANRFAPLLTFLKIQNLCGIDACSPAEVEHAMACGFTAKEISVTAGSYSKQDFEELMHYENLIINCDSLHAIKRLGELRPGSSIGIRINPAIGTGRSDNTKLQYTGVTHSKFGIYKEQFCEALDIARRYALKVNRIHFHTGCGYLNSQLKQWKLVLKATRWFTEQVEELTTINVGGGLGVPHIEGEIPLNLQQWARILKQHVGDKLRVEIEPGEFIVKDAGLLLLEKTYQEIKKDQCFVGVNAGFNIAPEPAHYSMPFQPVALRNVQETRKVTVVGNINEALDVWYPDIELPDLTGQDYLALINAGAYSSSMASNHCMRGRFSEFLLF